MQLSKIAPYTLLTRLLTMALHCDNDLVEMFTESWIMCSSEIAPIVLRMGAQIKRHGLKSRGVII